MLAPPVTAGETRLKQARLLALLLPSALLGGAAAIFFLAAWKSDR